jgi:hypothetical protein
LYRYCEDDFGEAPGLDAFDVDGVDGGGEDFGGGLCKSRRMKFTALSVKAPAFISTLDPET